MGFYLSEAADGVIPVAAGRRFASLPLDEAKLPGGRAGLFQITLTGEKKTKDGWGVAAIAAKRVLVTDTALIAKTSRDGSHVVHAADLVRGVPAAGLRAVLLGANGVPLETVTTDETGAARFATTRGLEREKAPAAVVVTNEATGDLAWLSLSDASNVDHDHDFNTAFSISTVMMPLAVRSELYLSLTSARKLANRPLSLAFRTSPFLAFHSCGVQDMPVEMAALLPSTVMRQSMLAVPSAFTFCLLM